MPTVEAQRKNAPNWGPSSLIKLKSINGIAPGDCAYVRVRVVGYVEEDGADVAICTPVKRDGKPYDLEAARSSYMVPVKHLVRADVVTKEVNGE